MILIEGCDKRLVTVKEQLLERGAVPQLYPLLSVFLFEVEGDPALSDDKFGLVQDLIELQASWGDPVFRRDLVAGGDEVELVRVVCTIHHVIEEVLRVADVPVVKA